MAGAGRMVAQCIREVGTQSTTLGWIGTGVMGLAMCLRLRHAGYAINVYTRTVSKAGPVLEAGAVVCATPQDVAASSHVVFTCVGFPEDVRDVILGPKGVLEGLRPGCVVVDMSTSRPSLALEIDSAAQERGCWAVDAPVSGGDRGAKEGSLAIMAGGDGHVISALAPLWACMGSCTHMGPASSGQSCKLANQVTIASTMVGMVEGMLYAHRAKLDVTKYLGVISKGAAASRSLDLYSDRILHRNMEPGFFVKHFVKDLGLALEEAQKMRLSLPGLALAQQLYVSLMACGEGDLGTQALVLALERLNSTRLDEDSAHL